MQRAGGKGCLTVDGRPTRAKKPAKGDESPIFLGIEGHL